MGARNARPVTASPPPSSSDIEDRKSERVELRTTAEQKRLLAVAAAHEHLDVTAFVLRAAIPAAREVIDRTDRVQLSSRDTARVLELLEHSPAPSRRLLRAAARLRANQALLPEHEVRRKPRPAKAAPAASGARSRARTSRRAR